MNPTRRNLFFSGAVAFLVATFAFCTPALAVVNHDLTDGAVTVSGTEDYVITGSFSGSLGIDGAAISVQDGYQGTITLNGVNIDVNASVLAAAMRIGENAAVTLSLTGSNVLKSGSGDAGIVVAGTAALTIEGSGTLGATGGDGGAGIGGRSKSNTASLVGEIKITGGTVTATGSNGGAGIGGANKGAGGTVTATGSTHAAGIGGGSESAGGTITITGGTVKASSPSTRGIGDGWNGGSSGTISISGGVVEATGAGAKDIGLVNTAGIVTITGGSVNPTRGDTYISNPKNANGTDLVRQTYTGAAGATISFGVNDSPAPKVPYVYTFTVPSDGGAYLWLPSTATTPSGNADITLAMTATAKTGGIELSASKSGGTDDATGYAWQRSTAATGPFEDLANSAGATYTDSTALDGTTYYYRVAPIVAGKIAMANPYSTPVVSATMPWLTGLSISAGTLTPAFASGTTDYTVDVANSVTNTTVTPTTNTPDATIKVNTVTVSSGTPSGSITLNEGANTIDVVVSVAGGASKTYKITVTRAGSGGDPGPSDPTDPAQSLSSLLSSLNTALGPKASVTGLSSIPAAVGTPITKATTGNATFAKKDAPGTAFPGYTVLAPSFSSSVSLGAGTTGNTLALKYTIAVAGLSGFESWASLTDAQRAALLDSLKVVFAYEYADKTWKTLVGAGGIVSWADALKAGIVKFTTTGIELNYAVTDAKGDPTASGSVLVVPDGTKDNKIVDPVWLLKGSASPVSVTLNKTTLTLRPGATFQLTATVSPDTATNKKVTWSSSNPNCATVDATGKVTAVANGTAVVTVKTEDGAKTATCTVTVSEAALEIDLSGLGLVNDTLKVEPGETVDLRIETDPAGATFTATGLPQGLTLTSDGRLYGTVPAIGTYTVTVTATLNGETASETFTIEVTDRGVKSGSSGGCDAGFFGGLGGLGCLTLAVLATARRRRERV